MISRRWVLQVGAGTVLSGFHGWAEEAALPAGVYGPSLNHLAHALQAANAKPMTGYRPQFFAAEEYGLMRRVVGILLGDVPGDVITGIVNWMDLTLADSGAVRAAARGLPAAQRALAIAYYGAAPVHALETEDPARTAREGLRALAGLQGVENDSVLAGALRSAAENAAGELGRFYAWARQGALDGYYTSREGLKELDYKGNAFYAESPGCSHGAPAG